MALIGSSSSCDALLRDDQSADYLQENEDHQRSLEEERDAWRRSYRDMVKV